ncbi:MAG: VOC family protein [Flavobacteriales bacterium]|nr:VOC family protein [Flavobacteriales bacterium]
MELQKITTCLWYNGNAEAAAKFYCDIFPNSRIGRIAYHSKESAAAGGPESGMKEGMVMTIEFSLNGHPFLGLNGGPFFKFSEAVSFVVNCKDQAEVDHYWNKLSEGGDPKAQICGWVKDKFGMSWQVVPTAFTDMMASNDKEKVAKVTKAMLEMKKLDLAKLEKAFNR